jgi:hypothetical protein
MTDAGPDGGDGSADAETRRRRTGGGHASARIEVHRAPPLPAVVGGAAFVLPISGIAATEAVPA